MCLMNWQLSVCPLHLCLIHCKRMKDAKVSSSQVAVWPLGHLTWVSPSLSLTPFSMPTHRSPKPAFPASWRIDPERLEETLNHLFVPYTPPSHYNLPPCAPMAHLNPEAADHKDWKGRIGQSPCLSRVIYLFMEALNSHLKVSRHRYRSTVGYSSSPTLTARRRLSLHCWQWEPDQSEHGDVHTGQVSGGLVDHEAGGMGLSLTSACQHEDLIPPTVNFLRWCGI